MVQLLHNIIKPILVEGYSPNLRVKVIIDVTGFGLCEGETVYSSHLTLTYSRALDEREYLVIIRDNFC